MTSSEIFSANRKAQIEDSPFSETFTLSPLIEGGESVTIRGIFNNSVEANESRRTNIAIPYVILASKPIYISGTTILTRENGEAYIMNRIEDADSAISTVIFLAKN